MSEETINLLGERAVYIVVVLLAIIILRATTNFFFKRVAIKVEKNLEEGVQNFRLVKYILNALWFVIGAFTIIYLTTPEETYTFSLFTENLKITIYIGFVSATTLVGTSIINYWFVQNIKRKKLTNVDTTNLRFLRYVLVVLVYILGFLLVVLAFPSLRTIAQTALGGAGVVAIVVAVSSQEALSNIISGIFIIFFKPFKVGDIIELESTNIGRVVDITLRHTVIENYDNKMIVIPNSIINKEKIINANLNDSKCCERIEIGISYDSDIDLAKKIIREECENHPLIIDNRKYVEKKSNLPIVKTGVIELGDFAITIRAWAWVANIEDSYQLRRDIYESVKKRFDKEGVEIPFPYRTIVMKKENNQDSKAL